MDYRWAVACVLFMCCDDVMACDDVTACSPSFCCRCSLGTELVCTLNTTLLTLPDIRASYARKLDIVTLTPDKQLDKVTADVVIRLPGLREVTLDVLQLKDVDTRNLQWENVTSFSAERNLFKTLHSRMFAGFGKLQTLNLRENDITSVERGAFVNLRYLRTLTVDTNKIQTLDAGVFRGLQSVTSLSLEDNKIRTIEDGVFEDTPALTHLDLQLNVLSDVTEGTFRNLTRLRTLILSSNAIQHIQAGAFRWLRSVTSLKLDRNRLTSVHRLMFTGMTKLTSLDLRTNQIAGMEDHALASSVHLTDLNLAGNRMTSLRPEVFPCGGSVRTIELAGNPLRCSCDLDRFTAWMKKMNVSTQALARAGAVTPLSCVHGVTSSSRECEDVNTPVRCVAPTEDTPEDDDPATAAYVYIIAGVVAGCLLVVVVVVVALVVRRRLWRSGSTESVGTRSTTVSGDMTSPFYRGFEGVNTHPHTDEQGYAVPVTSPDPLTPPSHPPPPPPGGKSVTLDRRPPGGHQGYYSYAYNTGVPTLPRTNLYQNTSGPVTMATRRPGLEDEEGYTSLTLERGRQGPGAAASPQSSVTSSAGAVTSSRQEAVTSLPAPHNRVAQLRGALEQQQQLTNPSYADAAHARTDAAHAQRDSDTASLGAVSNNTYMDLASSSDSSPTVERRTGYLELTQ